MAYEAKTFSLRSLSVIVAKRKIASFCLAMAPNRFSGLLAITSFVIHYLSWQAHNRFGVICEGYRLLRCYAQAGGAVPVLLAESLTTKFTAKSFADSSDFLR